MDAPSPDATILARIEAQAESAPRIADALADAFTAAVAAFEDPDGHWSVEAYFAHMPPRAAVRDVVATIAGESIARTLTFSTIRARDWTAASLAGLHPVAAGRFVVHGAHDRDRIAPNRIGIEIEAALAFGTGHHGTTRGCLLALDRLLKSSQPRRILDVGTGTGVLAIAAAKALRQCILAGDIDRDAVAIAKGNAGANHVGGLVTVAHARGVSANRLRACAPFDLVFANILLKPLQSMAAPIAGLLAPNARVILSGLLTAQANAALAAYRAQGLRLDRRLDLDGWVTLLLAR